MSKKMKKDENLPEKTENNGSIGYAKALARAKNNMNMQQNKLAAIYLSKVNWSAPTENLEIWIPKSEIMEKLGSEMDSTDQSTYLRKLAHDTVRNSELHFDGEDKDEWDDMPLFTRRKSTKNMMMMKVFDDAIELVSDLKDDYITVFLDDVLRFESNIDGLRGYVLYEYLRLYSDTRKMNTRIISTKDFKELFNIPKDGKGSYMRENGGFDRTNFERRVIEPALKMVAKCEHVVLHNFGTDKNGEPILYRKVKKNGMVQGYELIYTINKYPNGKRETIIDAEFQATPPVLSEPATPQDADVDKDQISIFDLENEASAADQREKDIEAIVEMMKKFDVTKKDAEAIYKAADGDMEHIAEVYEDKKNTEIKKSFVGLMITVVKPGVWKPSKKPAKKTGFHNFEGRSYTEEQFKSIEEGLLYGNQKWTEEDDSRLKANLEALEE